MLQKLNSKLSLALAALTVSLFTMPAFAAGAIDVSAVETAIEGAAAPIATIGAAVLIVLVGVKVYKWIRRAL